MGSKPQKVVFVLPSYAPGGAERVLITLMNRLDRKRFIPHFIAFRRNGVLKSLIADDVKIHQIGSFKRIFFGLPRLLLKLDDIKPDIVVTTMAHTNFSTILLKPFLPKKTRIVIREAITPSFIFNTMKVGWIAKILYKVLYPKADLVISPSQRIINEFRDLLGADLSSHKLLYNPVNIEMIRELPQILENKDKNRATTVHFICAGRLHPQKGFDMLIKALPFFKCDYEWKLTILGGGPERRKLTALIKKHKLGDKVFMPGFTQTPWPQIGEADCFLLPSRFEGLPNVALESLCVGTPVIATQSSGGIDEIAGLSNDGDVTVVETMPEFIEAMRLVKPNPARTYRPSLLPKEFEPAAVVQRFTNMLDGKDEFSAKNIKNKRQENKKNRQKRRKKLA